MEKKRMFCFSSLYCAAFGKAASQGGLFSLYTLKCGTVIREVSNERPNPSKVWVFLGMSKTLYWYLCVTPTQCVLTVPLASLKTPSQGSNNRQFQGLMSKEGALTGQPTPKMSKLSVMKA